MGEQSVGGGEQVWVHFDGGIRQGSFWRKNRNMLDRVWDFFGVDVELLWGEYGAFCGQNGYLRGANLGLLREDWGF
jgi:hypothetical protein